jgi:hypothetical protein
LTVGINIRLYLIFVPYICLIGQLTTHRSPISNSPFTIVVHVYSPKDKALQGYFITGSSVPAFAGTGSAGLIPIDYQLLIMIRRKDHMSFRPKKAAALN